MSKSSATDAKAPSGGTSASEIKAAAEAAKVVVDTYYNILDRVAPLKEFKELAERMEAERDLYSKETSKYIGDATAAIFNANILYDKAVGPVLEWCKYAIGLLDAIKIRGSLMDKTTATLFLKVCDEGTKQIAESLAYLDSAEEELRNTGASLIKIQAQLEIDCDSKSPFFDMLIKQQRTQSYASATVGLLLGPLGLIVAEGIAAGVTEASLVPNLQKQLEGLKNTYKDLRQKCAGSLGELTADVKKVTGAQTDMRNLRGGIGSAKVIILINPEDEHMVTLAFGMLLDSCTKYCNLYDHHK